MGSLFVYRIIRLSLRAFSENSDEIEKLFHRFIYLVQGFPTVWHESLLREGENLMLFRSVDVMPGRTRGVFGGSNPAIRSIAS